MDSDRSFVLGSFPMLANVVFFKHVVELTLTGCLLIGLWLFGLLL